jgi:hypothetical protein
MARGRARSIDSRNAVMGLLRRWWDGIDAARRAAVRRALVRTGVVVVLVLSVAVGLRLLEKRVIAMTRYHTPLRLEWTSLPDWLRAPANAHIVSDLTEACGLTIHDRILDPALPRRIADRLAAADLAWIAAVRRVEVRPDGVVAVDCLVRSPIAWVRQGATCYLVANDGVRLPGSYPYRSATASRLVVVEGVSSELPSVGRPWRSADVCAGIRVVQACADRPFASQIRRVLVDNHGGRRDPLRPQIELATDRPDSRIRWGRAPGEESGREISADQKLTLLESIYRQSGRIDMNRSYVNVTTWPDRVAAPVGESVAVQSGPSG